MCSSRWRGEVRAGRLLRLLPQAAIKEKQLLLCCPRRASLAPKLRAFIDAAKATAKGAQPLTRRAKDQTRGEGAHQAGEAGGRPSADRRAGWRAPPRRNVPATAMIAALTSTADDDEAEAEDKELSGWVGSTNVDELRKEGDEKQDDLRIGEIDHRPGQVGAAEGSRRAAAASSFSAAPRASAPEARSRR